MRKIHQKLLLVLFLVLILFAISYLSSRNKAPDPTANWKTYTSQLYNISFKYPSTWINSIETTTDNLISYITVGNALNTIDSSPEVLNNYKGISVVIFQKGSRVGCVINAQCPTGLKEISESMDLTSFLELNNKSNHLETRTIGGQTAIRFTYENIPPTGWVVKFNKNIYRISDVNAGQVYDQILSTFKFTD